MESLKQLSDDKANLIKKRDRLLFEVRKYKAILSATQRYMIANGIFKPEITLKFIKIKSKKRRPSRIRVLAWASPPGTTKAGWIP